jgi:hypothetical protein
VTRRGAQDSGSGSGASTVQTTPSG